MKNCRDKVEGVELIRNQGSRWVKSDRYLAAVGVRPSIGHTQLAGLGVAELEILVRKFVSINRLATSAITLGEVSSLRLLISGARSNTRNSKKTWSIKS